MSSFLKVLANETRIQILEELALHGVHTCGELVNKFSLAQSTISQHLKVLVEVGLVECENVRTSSQYSIKWDQVEDEMEAALRLFKRLLELKNLTAR